MKFFSLIKSDGVYTNKKILPAKTFSKLLKIEELVKETKKERDTLLEETEKECESLKEKAQEEGREEGLKQFNEHLLLINHKIREIEQNTLTKIVPIILKALKKILGKELSMHPESVIDIILQAIKPIREHAEVKLYVNKLDKDLIEKEKKKLTSHFSRLEHLTIEEREDIERGGCIIETESGIINATLENQWRALEAALKTFM